MVFYSYTVVPPTITDQPMSMEVGQGETVTFDVAATSEDGMLTYQWRLNGMEIVGGVLDTLILSNVMEADEGTYSVEVSNTQFSIISNDATLSVSK